MGQPQKARWWPWWNGGLTGGWTYTPITMTAIDSIAVNQLKMSAETVCSCFHVPPYMIGVGQPPTYNNIEALDQQYYSQCLQALIESIELCLDEGLALNKPLGTEPRSNRSAADGYQDQDRSGEACDSEWHGTERGAQTLL